MKVAIFNGAKLVKVVESSKDTFEPAEAQKFAEQLLKELETRSATNMTQGNESPSVTTKAEQQSKDLSAINQQATGVQPGKGPSGAAPAAPVAPASGSEEMSDVADEDDVPAAAEGKEEAEVFASKEKNLHNVIANLKNQLSQEKSERLTERKARRGLAIAKHLVVEGKLEDSYDVIKEKVAQIIKLEDSEIDRLERKIAGEQEFDSIEDANREIRRQARIARINRQAAAEAQEDLDEKQADLLDRTAEIAEAKVAHIQQVVEEMKKSAEAPVAPAVPPVPPTTEKPEEKKKEEKADDKKEVEPPKKLEECADAAEKPATGTAPAAAPAPVVETKPVASVKTETETDKTASLYRAIASNHRKLAEKAEADGDVAEADKQDELADQAEDKADEIKKKPIASTKKVADGEKKEEKKEEVPAAEVKEEAGETPEAPAVKAPEKEETGEKEEKKSHREPGQIQTDTSKHSPLQRKGEVVDDSFGIDKNASLVEQNDYADDPEVAMLSSIWRGAPKD
jgi:hypothetical protein